MLIYRRQLIVLCALAAALVPAHGQAAEATATNTTTSTTTTTATPSASSDKIKLGVFMESLCPDTRRFFLNQLVPTQLVLDKILDLNLVPFGHARTLGNNRMICQHGSRECEGNRRMACLLARSKNQTEIVQTFGCIFGYDDGPKGCVSKHMAQVDWAALEKCTAGDESYQLMVKAEKETGRVGYVPHLTVNGEFSEEIQDNAEHRLKEFLCKQYKGDVPLEACKNLPTEAPASAEQQ